MTHHANVSLDEVVDMLLDEFETPTAKAVAHYGALYPQFRQDLLCLAATWAEEDMLPEAGALTPEQEARVLLQAQSFLQNALHARSAAVAPHAGSGVQPAAARTLAQLAGDAGRSLGDVSAQMGLPLPIMSRLNTGGYRAETIPGFLRSRLAALLSATTDLVTMAIQPGAAARPKMAFLATSKPVVPPPGDFRADIAARADLTDDQKAELLREA